MSDQGMASIQFSNATSVQPVNFTPDHRLNSDSRDTHESPVGISSRYFNSADAATAWKVRRGGAPLPYSKRTSGSLYRFDEN